MPKICRIAATAACLSALAAAPAGAATTWTPVESGTTQDITAIEYLSDTRAWLGTGGGTLLTADPAGAFRVTRLVPGQSFTDVAFRASDGAIGVATTASGQIWRTIDGGATWSQVAIGQQVRNGCTPASDPLPVPRLNAAFWADLSTVYAVGGSNRTEPVVLRSTNGGATWTSVNFEIGRGCRLGSAGDPITDGFAVPGAPGSLRFITQSFGAIHETNDGLLTNAVETGEIIVNYTGVPRLAVDPENPQRMWAADFGSPACGSLCFTFSETGGADREVMKVSGDPAGIRRSLYGIAYAGGTVLAAGDSGEIYTSVDGKTAYLQRAGGLEAVNWRAVDLASATNALVGGAGGRLVRTANANAIPDTTPPTATLDGPATLTVGQAGTFTAAVADEAGGSGVDPASLAWSAPGTPGGSGPNASLAFGTPGVHTVTLSFRDLAGNAATARRSVTVTAAAMPRRDPTPRGRGGGSGAANPPNARGAVMRSTGGARLTLWKRVALSRGRYVPVRVSGRSARRFVIEVRRARRPRTRIAMAKARLGRAGGTKLVRVPLRASTRTGKYRVVVRVYQGRRAVGRRVTLAFVIAR